MVVLPCFFKYCLFFVNLCQAEEGAFVLSFTTCFSAAVLSPHSEPWTEIMIIINLPSRIWKIIKEIDFTVCVEKREMSRMFFTHSPHVGRSGTSRLNSCFRLNRAGDYPCVPRREAHCIMHFAWSPAHRICGGCLLQSTSDTEKAI